MLKGNMLCMSVSFLITIVLLAIIWVRLETVETMVNLPNPTLNGIMPSKDGKPHLILGAIPGLGAEMDEETYNITGFIPDVVAGMSQFCDIKATFVPVSYRDAPGAISNGLVHAVGGSFANKGSSQALGEYSYALT